MNWIFWRQEQIQEAKDALEQSKRERSRVDRIVGRLYVRHNKNHFAALMEQALMKKGQTDA